MGDVPPKAAMGELDWLPTLLQTVDPLFPIGSYAHSYGLEELTQKSRVHDADTLEQHIENLVLPSLIAFELPYLRFAYEAARTDNWDEMESLDSEINASLLSREIRQASVAQGRQRLSLLETLYPSPRLQALANLKSKGQIAPHHLVVYAVERIQVATPVPAALLSWAYQVVAAPCAAALKLMRIGQVGVQTALSRSLRRLPDAVKESLSVKRAFAGSFNPLGDIASARHESAAARLFIS